MKKYNVYQVLQVLFDGGYIDTRCLPGSEKIRGALLLSLDCELLGIVPVTVARGLFKTNALTLCYMRRSKKYDHRYYKVGEMS